MMTFQVDSTNIPGECPQHRVGIEHAVAVAVITHLNPPIVGHAVPERLGVFTLAVAHRWFSCITPPPQPFTPYHGRPHRRHGPVVLDRVRSHAWSTPWEGSRVRR